MRILEIYKVLDFVSNILDSGLVRVILNFSSAAQGSISLHPLVSHLFRFKFRKESNCLNDKKLTR